MDGRKDEAIQLRGRMAGYTILLNRYSRMITKVIVCVTMCVYTPSFLEVCAHTGCIWFKIISTANSFLEFAPLM